MLFPKCSFKVLLPHGRVVPGRRLEGILVVDVPEPIPRAEHLDLVFRSTAWAGYGSGKSRSVLRRDMFLAPMHVDLPKDRPMAAGEHRHPFSIDVPAWLPPAYHQGPDCGIVHDIEVRLDVDWALDPVSHVSPEVVVPPREGTRNGVTVRTPPGFHQSIVLEVTLESSVLVQGERLLGQVALRAGHQARFDAVELKLAGVASIVMGRGDRRLEESIGRIVRVPAERLRGGEPVPFEIGTGASLLPSFRNAFLEHEVVLQVSVDVPWAFDPKFELLLDLLPHGSTIHGDTAVVAVGQERLRQIASEMSARTGLPVGRSPVLVEGPIGPVSVRVTDAPRDGGLGVDLEFSFPDVELGIMFRPVGLLDGFRDSPLLSTPLRERYLLRCAPQKDQPKVADDALAAFFEAVLDGADGAPEVRLNDHHLGLHFALPMDDVSRMMQIARFVREKAEGLAKAVDRLPFPSAIAAAEPAWRATAREQEATLVPNVPALHNLSLRARVLGGEERAVAVTIGTTWAAGEAKMVVHLDLRGAELPQEACTELEAEAPSERLRPVRAVFPSAHALGQGTGVVLEKPGFANDPRELLPGLEAFLLWLLDVRGERRADAPYR